MSPPLPHRYPETYSLPHEYTETRNRNEAPSPFKQMSQLAQRQQQHIEELTHLLRQQTARLDETERELTRQKEKRASDKSELKRLRREVDNWQCLDRKPARTNPSRREVVSAVRQDSYRRGKERVGYVKEGYPQEERTRPSPQYDEPHSRQRENSGRSSGRLPDRSYSFERYSTDPRAKRRKNNEHWKGGLSAERNCGFAQQGVSRELREGYEVRREKGNVGRLGKPVREIPAGLAAAAARERRRYEND